MKKKILRIFFASILTYSLLVPANFVQAQSNSNTLTSVESAKNAPQSKEGVNKESIISVGSKENLVSSDGQFVMKYVDADDIHYVGEKKSRVQKKQMPNYNAASAEDFYNDCASDYGFVKFEDELNGVALQKAYLAINEVLNQAYMSDTDFNKSLLGDTEVYVAGRVNYLELGLDRDEIFKVLAAVKNDHPLLYFVSNIVYTDGEYIYIEVEDEYAMASERTAVNAKLKEVIQSYDSKVGSVASNKDLVTLIHDDVISNVTYAYETDGVTPKNTNTVHTILGYVSDEKEVVCDGYVKTLGAILNYLDLDTIFVGGWGVPQGEPTSDANTHAWLLVKLGDEKYYAVDATWDDTNATNPHKYLLVGNSIYEDHSTIQNGDSSVVFVQYELPELPKDNCTSDDALVKREDPSYVISENITYEYADGVLTFKGRGKIEDNTDYRENPWYQYHDLAKKIVFDNRITQIGAFAFRDFEKLETIVWPKGLKKLGAGAFEFCESLKQVSIPRDVPFIDVDVFSYCKSLESIEIGKCTVTFTLGEPFLDRCPNLKSITVEEGHIALKSVDGVLYDGKILESYPAMREGSSFSVPDGIEKIACKAFNGCQNLESVSMTNSVLDIDDSAFVECANLQDIELSNKIQQLKSFTFNNCKKLKEIQIPDSVESIALLCFGGSGLEKISLGENVKEVAMNAFSQCGDLTEITSKCFDAKYGFRIDEPNPNLVLKGYKGSTLDTYAQRNNLKFETIVEKEGDMCVVSLSPAVLENYDVYHGSEQVTENTTILFGEKLNIKRKEGIENAKTLVINDEVKEVSTDGTEYVVNGYTVLDVMETESISTKEDLINALKSGEKKIYNLEADIELSDWQMQSGFRGILLGNQHKLTFNSYECQFSSIHKAGLVENNWGSIKDLDIDIKEANKDFMSYPICLTNYGSIADCNVTMKGNTENTATGMVGTNSGNIDNCTVDMDVTGSVYVCGFCMTNEGKISNSQLEGEINAMWVYGIARNNRENAVIESTKMCATLNGDNAYGFGENEGVIKYCGVLGTVNGTTDGYVYSPSGTILHHYKFYDGDTLLKEEEGQYGATIDYVPEKEGFVLDGWYNNKEFDGTSVTSYMATEDGKEYYAKWMVSEHALVPVEAKEATCLKDGNKQYYRCTKCDKIFSDAKAMTETTVEAQTIKATGHEWDNGTVTKEATTTEEGEKVFACIHKNCTATKQEVISKLPSVTPVPEDPGKEEPGKEEPGKETPKPDSGTKNEIVKNQVVKDKMGNSYKVTNPNKKEVAYMAPANKRKKTVTIDSKIVIGGVTYKVTKLEAKAFKNNTTVTKVIIPSSIVSIGTNAFSGCKKIKTITIKSQKLTAKTVSQGAFKGLSKKVIIKVPKKKQKVYKKLFEKKGFKGKVKVYR